MGSKARKRLAAVLLGSSLAVLPISGLAGWQASYVSGQETCTSCGLCRNVDRRGPLWFETEPFVPPFSRRPDPLPTDCLAHHWTRSGCWIEGSSARKY